MEECFICTNVKDIIVTKCGHKFCDECVVKLSNDNCPLCKSDVNMDELADMLSKLSLEPNINESKVADDILENVSQKIEGIVNKMLGKDDVDSEDFANLVDTTTNKLIMSIVSEFLEKSEDEPDKVD